MNTECEERWIGEIRSHDYMQRQMALHNQNAIRIHAAFLGRWRVEIDRDHGIFEHATWLLPRWTFLPF